MENKISYPVFLSVRAEKELVSSFTWYEDQQKNLGSRFIDEVFIQIHKIEHNPELYAQKYKLYREVVLPKFPFVIIYRINKPKNIVRIVSVFHTSRNPRTKYK